MLILHISLFCRDMGANRTRHRFPIGNALATSALAAHLQCTDQKSKHPISGSHCSTSNSVASPLLLPPVVSFFFYYVATVEVAPPAALHMVGCALLLHSHPQTSILLGWKQTESSRKNTQNFASGNLRPPRSTQTNMYLLLPSGSHS